MSPHMLHLSCIYAAVLSAVCCVLCCIYAVVTGDLLFQEHDGSPVVQPVISCRTRAAVPTIRLLQSGKCGRMHNDVISSGIFAGPGINVGEIDLFIPGGRPDALRLVL